MNSENWPALDPYIFDVLMADLVGHDQRASAFLVYLCLARLVGKEKGESVRVSLQRLALATGLSRSTVQDALAHLAKRQLITTKRASPTAVPQHTVHRPWARRGITP